MTWLSTLGVAWLAVGALAIPQPSDQAPFPTGTPSNLAAAGTVSGTASASGTGNPTTKQPATVTPPVPSDQVQGGRISIPEKPTQCLGNYVPFETTVWVEANQMNLDDEAGSWWGSDEEVEWTFSTNTSHVVFAKPDFIIEGPDNPTPNIINRTDPSKFTIKMSGNDGSMTLFWQIFYVDEHTVPQKYWNISGQSGEEPLASDNVTFQFTITGKAPCDHPVGNTSCAENTEQRTPDQWSAYGVDEFLSDYIDNKWDQSTPFMQAFQKDFNVGSGTLCTIESSPCALIDVCNDLPNHGKNPNAAQVYFTWIALQNLSDMFNGIYSVLLVGETSTFTQIASMAMTFNYIHDDKIPATKSPWSTAGGVLGAISGFVSLIPGALPETAVARLVGNAQTGGAIAGGVIKGGAVGGGITGLASGLMGVVNMQKQKDGWQTPDSQYAENEADISKFLGSYTDSLRTQIEDTYTNLFTHGQGLTDLLSQGAFVNRTALGLDCNECLPHRQAWMQQYLSLKMINDMWWGQNVFITYMPYGDIIQIDTHKKTSFTIDDCYGNFQSPSDAPLTVCSETGMARLAWFNPYDKETVKMDKNGYGSLNLTNAPPGFNGSDSAPLLNTTGLSTYTFDAHAVINSSVAGFFAYGYSFDGVGQNASDALSSTDPQEQLDLLTGMFSTDPSTPGMFNLPVCVIDDLNYWPTFYSSSSDRSGGDNICQCYEAKDKNGNWFVDNVAPDLKYVSTHMIGSKTTQTCEARDSSDEPPWDTKNAPS